LVEAARARIAGCEAQITCYRASIDAGEEPTAARPSSRCPAGRHQGHPRRRPEPSEQAGAGHDSGSGPGQNLRYGALV